MADRRRSLQVLVRLRGLAIDQTRQRLSLLAEASASASLEATRLWSSVSIIDSADERHAAELRRYGDEVEGARHKSAQLRAKVEALELERLDCLDRARHELQARHQVQSLLLEHERLASEVKMHRDQLRIDEQATQRSLQKLQVP